MCGSKLVVNYN